MKALVLLLTFVLTVVLFESCDLRGSGTPVPTLPADFVQGATIPGWVLRQPSGGREEVRAEAVHSGGQWKILLSRSMKRRPRDVPFSIAITDNGTAHSGSRRLLLTSDPNATADGLTLRTHEVPDGQVTPDGALSPGEWNFATFQTVALSVQNTIPVGLYPLPIPITLTIASAYDSEFMYFFLRWQDSGGAASELGPLLQWDGSAWVRRPHAENDTNGNGLLDPGEFQSVQAQAEDEDRVFFHFPIEDESAAFAPGELGCATSCHVEPSAANGFAPPGHYGLTGRNLVDVWEWGAASTAPGRRMRDGQLTSGQLSASDAGAPSFLGNDPLAPTHMFQTTPPGYQALFGDLITFSQPPAPFPVIPSVSANAALYDASNFNGSGGAPVAWTGIAPFFGDDFLPPFVQFQPTESSADIEAGSSFAGGQWTLEIRRPRVTRDGNGDPRTDDVQFDEDVDFLREAFQVAAASQGLPLSLSVTDNAAGHGVRESRYAGPVLLSADTSLTGPVFTDRLVIVDYGAGFSPQSADDLTDPRQTTPTPTGGQDVGLTLKAGSDGGETLFLAATWNDADADSSGRTWSWNGFSWELLPAEGEDELRILFAGSVPRSEFLNGGCAVLCHQGPSPPAAPSYPAFGTTMVNRIADLWHWRAARSQPFARADDAGIDWRFFGQPDGASAAVALHGDGQDGLFAFNDDTLNGIPLWMSASDPNANAPFLGFGIAGTSDAIPFVDVTAGLPPTSGPPTPGASFSQDVLPIFQAQCTSCHFSGGFGGLDLTTWAATLAGGVSGAVINPGDPANSLLIERLDGSVPPLMPEGGPAMDPALIAIISQWIQEGALDN